MNRLSIYRTHADVTLPKFATAGSACFDLAFQSAGKIEYSGFNKQNAPFTRRISEGKIVLMPGDRILVPTGYIFDIPEKHSVRIHARSGLSLKQGLVLANSEAVIDSDYVEETMIMLTNISDNQLTISNGDRIAQAEMIKNEEYILWETQDRPVKKTERDGGLGSTGVSINTQETIVPVPPVKRGRGRPRKVA